MGNQRLFPFRVLKWSWGIAIDIVARALLEHTPTPDDTLVGNRVWLRIQEPLPEEALKFLVMGAQAISARIEEVVPQGAIIIEIEHVEFSPTDYQDEAMAAALIGWATEEFGLEEPDIGITFDRGSNRYAFEYGKVLDSQ